MTTYLCLLRGINVGGNNIIPMAKLKAAFEQLGFSDVRTYIQSGNVIFNTKTQSPRTLEQIIEQALTKQFRYPSKVVIRTKAELAQIFKAIPNHWFTDATRKYNVIFLRDVIDHKTILKEFKPKPEIETVSYKPGVLFWSAKTSDLTRSAMIKLAGDPLYKEMTVRNLNTTQKLFHLMQTLT